MGQDAKQSRPLEFRGLTSSDADLLQFASCFADNGMTRSVASVRWQFADNPTDRVWIDVAADAQQGGRLAAIYALLPVRVWLAGKVALASQSVDTITDKGYRGQGLFLKLAQSCYARAHREGAQLVYGFPNGSSAHGFFSRLHWTRLDPVPFLVRPIRWRYVIERLGLRKLATGLNELQLPTPPARPPAGVEIVTVSTVDSQFTDVWHDFASTVDIAVERDSSYLRWRLAKPDVRYRCLGAYRGGQLEAYCVFTVEDKHGGRVGYVLELLHRRGNATNATLLLRAALFEMAADRADVVLAWNLPHSVNRSSFLRNGFLPLPERLRPIELHFGARAFDAPGPIAFGNRRSWYLSYFDSDTV